MYWKEYKCLKINGWNNRWPTFNVPVQHPCNSKVSKLHSSIFSQEDVLIGLYKIHCQWSNTFFAKRRCCRSEKYLWFDVPVKDFSIMHMFECQTNLYKPIQDLQNTADGKETLLWLQYTYAQLEIWFSKSYVLSLSKCLWLTWSSENRTPLWELIFLKRSPPSQ